MGYLTCDHSPVLAEIAAERVRQDAKWGEQSHPAGTGGESAQIEARWAKERCQKAAADGNVTWQLILEEEVTEAYAETDPDKLRAELLQTAAVCVAWIEAIDRRKSPSSVAVHETTKGDHDA